jgi:putative hemolysin
MFGINPRKGKDQISGEELRDLVAAHEDLTVEERALIDDVFAVGDRELREVMIPRTEVDFLDASLLLGNAVTVIADKPHSRYPVIRGSADDVVGFVHIRDLLDPAMSGRQVRLGELARPVTAFPGTKVILSALTEMRRIHQHIAIVQDEYGGTAGIVTLEDLVEEVIGDIKDEYDAAETPRAPRIIGEITVDGLMNIEDFSDECGVTLSDGPYETVAGFLVSHLSRLPAPGDAVDAAGLRFEVSEMDGRRIARVHVTRLPE